MVDILEVREISVEERIEREERESLDNIKTEYLTMISRAGTKAATEDKQTPQLQMVFLEVVYRDDFICFGQRY